MLAAWLMVSMMIWPIWLDCIGLINFHLIFSKSMAQWKRANVGLKIDSYPIAIVKELRILGVIFDNEVRWTNHINMISSKLSSFVDLLH